MLFQEVTNVSFVSFREASRDKKVVLLYPWTHYRNLFLSFFLDDAKDGLLYYRVPDRRDNLRDWLRGLVEALSSVVDGFGHNLAATIDEGAPEDMARAFAADVRGVKKERVLVFFDELDRVPQDSNFRRFVQTLIAELPDNAQIAVNSRLLTYQPWSDLVASGEAVVLGTAHRRNSLTFTTEEVPRPQLEVFGFGQGYALVNGKQIENWDGALPRNLFFYFIDNPLVTRDQIFEVFWPALSVKEATNVFHVTKRKITERISMQVEDGENYELTQYSTGFYMPSDKIVRHYDVADFQEAIEQALVLDSVREQENLYRRAIDLYKAPFLQTVSMEWVQKRREELKVMYADALIGLGRILKQRGDVEGALNYLLRSLKETPQREDIHREVMMIYTELGRNADAIIQYNKLVQYLDETIRVPPSRETRELHEWISSQN